MTLNEDKRSQGQMAKAVLSGLIFLRESNLITHKTTPI